MCAATLTLPRLSDAQREIESALSAGDVLAALACAQVLWCFCGDLPDLDARLQQIRTTAQQAGLAPDELLMLSSGLAEHLADVEARHLLAPA